MDYAALAIIFIGILFAGVMLFAVVKLSEE